jgi:hypothetical protein
VETLEGNKARRSASNQAQNQPASQFGNGIFTIFLQLAGTLPEGGI